MLVIDYCILYCQFLLSKDSKTPLFFTQKSIQENHQEFRIHFVWLLASCVLDLNAGSYSNVVISIFPCFWTHSQSRILGCMSLNCTRENRLPTLFLEFMASPSLSGLSQLGIYLQDYIYPGLFTRIFNSGGTIPLVGGSDPHNKGLPRILSSPRQIQLSAMIP